MPRVVPTGVQVGMDSAVREVEERYAPFTAEQKAELKALAQQYYWRFNSIEFHPSGLRVISGDQGGYPFPALVLDIAAEPEVVVRCCLACLRALKR